MKPEKSALGEDTRIQQAFSLQQTGRLDEASTLIRTLLDSFPSDTRFWASLGIILLQQGKAQEGVEALGKALGLAPNQPMVLCNHGLGLMLMGKHQDALVDFDRAIALQPGLAAAHFNRGNALREIKQPAEALDAFDQVIVMQPGNAEAHNNRGAALHELGRLDEALAAYDRAVTLLPGYAGAHYNRGNALLELHRLEEAISSYDRTLSLQLGNPAAHNNRGNALRELDRNNEALAAYDRVVALAPNHPEGHYNRGNALKKLDRNTEALAAFDRTLALRPNYPEAHNNRGLVLQELKRPADALNAYDGAIVLQPGSPAAHNNRGVALRELKRPAEALEAFDRAIAFQPGFAEAHNNRGTALQELRRLEEALASYERAVTLQPGYAAAQMNKAQFKLLTGDFSGGWELFEWRWKGPMRDHARNFAQPLWLGNEPLDGRVLLVYSEQGFGDAIQFCRYVPLAEKRGAKVVIEAPQALIPLLSTLNGNFAAVGWGKHLPAFDLQCPLQSLPLAFKTTVESIPAQDAYLFADPLKQAAWRQKLGLKTAPHIGLAWSGRPSHKNDHNRSIPLETLLPLTALPYEFHSLQREYRDSDQAYLREPTRIRDHQGELVDFSDTAALVSEMDLIVSVDTSVAHLAGALGKCVWILLPFMPDYRWLLDRPNSPWYPTATLLRQPEYNDWPSVVAEVVHKIRERFG